LRQGHGARPHTSFASGAAPCHHAFGARLRRYLRSYLLCERCGVRPSRRRRAPTVRGPQYQPASRFSRAFLRPSIVPEVVTCGAAVGACERGQQSRQNLPLLGAMRRGAIVQDGVVCGATRSACERASSTCRLHISYVQRGALPSRRKGSPAVPPSTGSTGAGSTSRPGIYHEGHRAMPFRRFWPPAVRPAACDGVRAAPAGRTFPTSMAAPECQRGARSGRVGKTLRGRVGAALPGTLWRRREEQRGRRWGLLPCSWWGNV